MSRGKCCIFGCGSIVALAALVLLIAYNATGRYKPTISPAPPLPKPNAFDDYLAAGVLFQLNGGDKLLYDQRGQLDILNASSVVQANQPALARLREGFAKQCGIPIEPRLDSEMDYLSNLRALARLLNAESEVYATGGNYGRAARCAIEAIHLGGDIERGGLFIHGLVGVAIQAIGQASLERRISKMTGDELDTAIRRLEWRALRQVRAHEVLVGERNWMLTALANANGSEGASIAFPSDIGEEDSNSSAKRVLGGIVWHFARDRTLRDFEKYMDALIIEAQKPSGTRKAVPEPGGIAGILVPVFANGTVSLNRADLRNRLLLIEMAIRRYRLKHDDLPKSLSSLGLNPKSLIDPDSHKEIIYRPQGRDYLLYGVGPDGRDDGGVPADEGTYPMQGDLGIRGFRQIKPGSAPTKAYRLVPHMKSPKVPAGSPPLKD